jgi:hypothetical protein
MNALQVCGARADIKDIMGETADDMYMYRKQSKTARQDAEIAIDIDYSASELDMLLSKRKGDGRK